MIQARERMEKPADKPTDRPFLRVGVHRHRQQQKQREQDEAVEQE